MVIWEFGYWPTGIRRAQCDVCVPKREVLEWIKSDVLRFLTIDDDLGPIEGRALGRVALNQEFYVSRCDELVAKDDEP